MKKIVNCRRTLVSLVGMTFLLILGLQNKVDVSMAIAGIVASIAAANATQGVFQNKQTHTKKEGE